LLLGELGMLGALCVFGAPCVVGAGGGEGTVDGCPFIVPLAQSPVLP
jgi:hypothetical protein